MSAFSLAGSQKTKGKCDGAEFTSDANEEQLDRNWPGSVDRRDYDDDDDELMMKSDKRRTRLNEKPRAKFKTKFKSGSGPFPFKVPLRCRTPSFLISRPFSRIRRWVLDNYFLESKMKTTA